MEQARFEGVRVPDPGFPGDTGGGGSRRSRRSLAAYAATPDDPATYAAALTSLAHRRLLVPVVAVLGEVEVDEHGLAHDKSSDMAAVLLTGARRSAGAARLHRDGADGTGGGRTRDRSRSPRATPPGRRWPTTPTALVVDVAGPATLVVTGRPLRALAGEGLRREGPWRAMAPDLR